MKLHGNARTCPNSRALIARRVLDENWSLTAAAEAAGVSEPTARKWVRRARAGETLEDRSSRPWRSPARLSKGLVQAIEALRRLWMTAAQISEVLSLALSTVSRWLRRIGLGKLSRLEPPEPPNRYERARPGELIHVDVKKLGRILRPGHRVTGNRRSRTTDARGYGVAGWEFVHVCVDDATRLAYAEVLGDEKATTAVAFLRRATRFFYRHGVTVERVLTDNGSAYRSAIHAIACRALGIRHLRTRPRRPQTNGKAERFIRTMLGGWAYGAIYRSSAERTAALEGWLWRYNFRRPHGSLSRKTPAARLRELNNPLGSYT